MMHRLKILLVTLCLTLGLILTPFSAKAANIHIRYFEAADAILDTETFQIFSFSALQGENVTLVAYGLQEDLIPALTVLDIEGRILAEDLNPNSLPVASLQLTAPANGLYTFLVSRLTQTGGLVRALLFVGDPLTEDLSLLDTIDPFLPSRAFLFGGDENDPVRVAIAVPENQTPISEVYASRGTDLEAPPLAERTTPVQTVVWENNQGDVFYTVTIRTAPDPLPVTRHHRALFAKVRRQSNQQIFQIDVNQGSPNPEFVERPICLGTSRGTTLLAGPSTTYRDQRPSANGEELEVVGENGDFYLVVDLDNPLGGSWIPKNAIDELTGLGQSGSPCARVREVPTPALTDANRRPVDAPPNQQAGGLNPFAGLPPLENDDTRNDQPDGVAGGQTAIVRPVPPPPGVSDDTSTPVINLYCDTSFSIVKMTWSGIGAGDTISISFSCGPAVTIPGNTTQPYPLCGGAVSVFATSSNGGSASFVGNCP